MSGSQEFLQRMELIKKIRVAYETDLEIRMIYPDMNDFAPNFNHSLSKLLEQRKQIAKAYFETQMTDSAKEDVIRLFERTNYLIMQTIGL